MTQHLILNQIIDATDARVIVRRDAAGQVIDARFDLSGLPRVDTLMAQHPVTEVPALAQRLCGICPVAHHLAGVQALEALLGAAALTPTAQLVRRLLNFGSVIDSHTLGFAHHDLPAVITLRRLAKAAMTAAGSPKHFPTTAVVGGVAKAVAAEHVASLKDTLADAQTAAHRLIQTANPPHPDTFTGADVALIGDNHHLDLLGHRLRAVTATGTTIANSTANHWDQIVAEENPGDPAPRPYLLSLGPTAGIYRTGPVAQLRVATLSTPQAAAAQQQWLSTSGSATAARAIIVLHCVEAISAICQDPNLTLHDLGASPNQPASAGVGVGWAETGRGLLVHRYETDDAGLVTRATILTPTAQNEPWLAALLTQAQDIPSMEDALRQADPCLPCSTAPPGQMGLVVITA